MEIKRIHQVLGIAMLIPLLLWSLTGIFFLIKPGYEGAYQKISPKFYDIETAFTIVPEKGWSEIRLMRSVLGYHLLVNADGQWQHLDPNTLKPRSAPETAELNILLTDAISKDIERYGSIIQISDNTAYTNTGVEISLDWSSLTLRQQGKDTQFIRLLYRIHYMEWLDNPSSNKVLGALAITMLLTLSAAGFIIYIKGRNYANG